MRTCGFVVIVASLLLAAACGDDEESSSPNNIIILPDTGLPDTNTEDDAGMDVQDDVETDVEPDSGEPAVLRVGITPQVLDLKIQEIRKFTATLYIDEIASTEDETVTWLSTNPAVATVDEAGNVTGVSAGTAQIQASIRGQLAQASVNVYTVWGSVSTGSAHSCAAKVDGRVACWGDNTHMQAGGEDLVADLVPDQVLIGGGQVAQNLYLGANHSCALLGNGTAMCWGDNRMAQVDLEVVEEQTAIPVTRAFASPAKKLALGDTFTCALLEDGKLSCWGDNTQQVIDTTESVKLGPTNPHPAMTFRDVAAGRAHVCAIASDFNLYCWGDNSANQLGDNAEGTGGHTPIRIGDSQYVAVDAFADQTCAYSLFDGLQCWGTSDGGFGDLAVTSVATPTAMTLPDPNFQRMAVGRAHVCVVAADATYCWGKNDKGQLADNTVVDRATPAAVFGMPNFPSLDCGDEHCCGVSVAGDTFCWGEGASGQVGNGTAGPVRTPTAVSASVF